MLLQVADDSGNDLLPGREWYEEALAAASPASVRRGPTSGRPTTCTSSTRAARRACPRACCGARPTSTGRRWAAGTRRRRSRGSRSTTLVEAATAVGIVVLPAAPFMHGAGHWIAFLTTNSGGTIVIQDDVVDRLDPADVCAVIQRERVNFLQLVGDAFGRPIVEEMETGRLGRLVALHRPLGRGCPLGRPEGAVPRRRCPHAMIIDGLGFVRGRRAGDAGDDGRRTGEHGHVHARRRFAASWPRTCRPCSNRATRASAGWRSAATSRSATSATRRRRRARSRPIAGERFSVPGDRARHLADGTIELLGRDSVTVNCGGEKIFVEEVEAAIVGHPDVYDVVVCGRPSERWGQEVVAIVRLRDGVDAGPRNRGVAAPTRPPATSPGTSCRRSGSSSRRSCGRPPGRPTTAGPARWPRRASLDESRSINQWRRFGPPCSYARTTTERGGAPMVVQLEITLAATAHPLAGGS